MQPRRIRPGTVVPIVPFNFPVLLFGWQAAAALAAGNAVIVKPSELDAVDDADG